MSIKKYFRPLKEQQDLPDPTGPLSEKVPSMAIAPANVKVVEGSRRKAATIILIPDPTM